MNKLVKAGSGSSIDGHLRHGTARRFSAGKRAPTHAINVCTSAKRVHQGSRPGVPPVQPAPHARLRRQGRATLRARTPTTTAGRPASRPERLGLHADRVHRPLRSW